MIQSNNAEATMQLAKKSIANSDCKKKRTKNINSQQFCWPFRAAAFKCTSACLHRNTPLLLSPETQSISLSQRETSTKN